MTQKQPYPYAYPTKLGDYNYVGLPDKKYFRNELKGGQNISDDDYQHAKKTNEQFGCKTFLDFHKLYLSSDVTLLADVFEMHRKFCQELFQLDVSKYLSNAHFSFDAFLKRSKIQLELLSDVQMYSMLESGIRGGISVISKKYARANNEYMGDMFDPNKPSVFLWYVDATNLYGHAMSQYLPIDNFQWVNGTQDELMRLLLYTPDDGEIGYIACVDLKYPIELHDETNCFPLAPEKINIKYEQLSGYSKKLADKLHIPKANGKIAKLAPNLFDKSRYVVHYRNLKYYIRRGMILSEVHHMISFRQSKFMVNYIEETTERRRAATNDFERLYHKLCANSLYGKKKEKKRNIIDILS